MHDQLSKYLDTLHLLYSNCLVVSKVQAATCKLANPDRSTELIAITATLLAFAFVVVILRLVSRTWVSSMIGIDDWMIILALVRGKIVDRSISTWC